MENLAICSHSTSNNGYIVFSVFDKDDTYRNNISIHKLALQYLESLEISYKVLEGTYNNVQELSVLVSQDHEALIIDIGEIGKQESILCLDTHKHGLYTASLYYVKTQHTEAIGFFREVSEDYALTCDAFSYDEQTGKHFAVTDTDTTTACEVLELGYNQ